MVLKASGAFGVVQTPTLQALDKIVRDAGGAKLFCGLPYLAATDIAVRVARIVTLLRHRNGQIPGEGVLQSLVHPGGKQRFCDGAAYLERERIKDWRPVRTDNDARIDVLVRSPTLAVIVGA